MRLGFELDNDAGILALLEAFQRGIQHWYDRGEIGDDDRDQLLG